MIRNTITFGVSPVPRGSRLSNLRTVIPESSRRTRPRGHAEPTVPGPGSRHRHGPRCPQGKQRCVWEAAFSEEGGVSFPRFSSSQGREVWLCHARQASLSVHGLAFSALHRQAWWRRSSPIITTHRGCGAHQPRAQPVTASSAGRSPSRHPPPPGRLAPDPAGLWAVTALPSATPDPKLSSPSARSSLAGWRWLRLRGAAPGASEHLPAMRGGDGAVVQAHHSFRKEASRLRLPKGLQVRPSIGHSHVLQTIFTVF